MKLRTIPALAAIAAVAAACGSNASGSTTTTSSAASSSSTTANTPTTANPTAAVTLNESGSSILYPYLQEIEAPFHSAFSNITLAPNAGGSGKGISDAITGTSQLGGSDAYLSPGQMQQNTGLENIPVVISAVTVDYNLPGVNNLKLSPQVLADIYQGKITKWNDASITALNPGVTLPATTIVPVRPGDVSGATFNFTSLLSKAVPAWSSSISFGTTVSWPAVQGELTATGALPLIQTCKANPGCIVFDGVNTEAAATAAKLGEAALQNQAGNFELPTAANIAAAATASTLPSNLAASLIYAPGANSYPMANFEYLVINKTKYDANTALAVKDLLSYSLDPNGGAQSQYLSKEGFVALPSSVVSKVDSIIAGIGQ